jgi:hypothetical protein
MLTITEQNLVALLLDDYTRKALFKQLKHEERKWSGNPLLNRIIDMASNVVCTEQEFLALQQTLLRCGRMGEEILGDFTFHPNFPLAALYELIHLGKCICDISHRSGPIELLLTLIESREDCSEAIITVAQYYFVTETVATETFTAFVQQHFESVMNESHLSCLFKYLYSTGHKSAKADALYDIICSSSYASSFKRRLQESETAAMLEQTPDVQIITEYFASQNPRYWLALSVNPQTPLAILLELAQVHDLKYCKAIRNNARQGIRESEFPLNLVTERNLVALLVDDDTRKALFKQLYHERGSGERPLRNRIYHIAPNVVCTAQEFLTLQQTLLHYGTLGAEILGHFSPHPAECASGIPQI